MAKLWDKGYSINSLIEEFTVGNDWELDNQLVAADCTASIAHAEMLASIGIVTREEAARLKKGLLGIIEKSAAGKFPLSREDEDCHTAIEQALTEQIGEAGKKIHTGRSRNDQVQTALRLWMRAYLLDMIDATGSLVSSLARFAEQYRDVPMPGRTHMQIAMPSSIGLWAASFAEELEDEIGLLMADYRLIDQCPLGSAASYGVPLPLDRELTAEKLGFSKVQNNVLYANNSRGKFESILIDSADYICLTLSKAAQDLILFSLPEFGYFSLPKELCTGSSIMPQKKNPDVLELIRSKSAAVSACAFQTRSIIRSLPTGYNRDFQDTKEPLLKAARTAYQCVKVMEVCFDSLEVHAGNLRKAFTPEIYATDKALEAVAAGRSFRDAYKQVGTNLEDVAAGDPDEALKLRTSTGTAGNLGLAKLEKLRKLHDEEYREIAGAVDSAMVKLTGKSIDFFRISG